ncbi:unnamed protein product [Cladocopium goreaui]|uniref:Retrovirus-related Pol polyprotein from transposon TNT 1-94 n=1 Tax=Cladocopium goreaui TaxID=2562237 RepID=A0A9P1BHT0_9DINO|nr:unnamed protein product [Cladocopium goreaui]
MGREILAMVLDHFRTTSKDEVLFNASHIYKLQYRGDKEMDKFLHAWIEIIANMKAEDIPSDNTLRDHLLRKIDGSQALHVDLTIFKGRDNDDKKKSYSELLEIMRRHIARAREDRNIAARDKFATDYTNLGKPSTPAPKPTAPAPTPKDGKGGKPSAPAPKGKPGAPVLPSGNPKSHGKGKGKGGKRSRSPSTRDKGGKGGKGKNSRSATPRRSQTPGGKKDRHCYGWLKGDCQKGDKCTFKHDPSMKGKRAAPSTKTPDAKATPALVREYDDDFIVNAVPIEKKNKMDVKFNDKVETIVYVKPDFVECSNRKPKRNMSRAQKKSLTCRTTKEIMDDQQWVLQSKLGMTRARAIGILMDDYGEFSDVDEVHIILGPKNDIKLKINNIDFLESNSRAEICYEEVIPHVPGQYGRRDNVMCITMPIELKDRRFIMDSGSGHDLISSTRVDRMDIDTYQSDRVNFHTANGITSTTTMVDLDFDTSNDPARAHVLEDTPSVLSLGKRCMEQGYTFVWPSGREPYMINSEGGKIKMEVHDLIPYVYLGAKDYRPSSDYEAELVMKVLGLNGNNHASRTIYLDGESGDEMSESDDGVGTYVDGPTKSLKKTKKKKRSKRKTTPVAAGEELDDDDDYEQSIREGEMDIKLDKEKADDVEVVDGPPLPPPDGEPPYDGPEHHSMGKPGDGIIYLSDIGEHVKLDKRGRPYRVGPDGRKEVRGSPRPKSSYSPEEWRALSAKERDVIIRRGKLEEEAEKLKEIKLKKEKEKKAKAEISEKKKHDSSSSKDPAKDESRKKKKKDNKKSKESSGKDGGKDAAVNVGTLRGRNPWECSPTPHGASDLDDIKKREKDELAGKFRFGKTILITDLNYKCQANSGGTTNIQYGLDEMGYVVTVVDINSFKSVTRAQKFLDAVEHLIKSVMPNITAEENVTIHFWISFAFLITDTHPYHVWVERNYAERLAEAIRRVDKLATRPIFVSLCKDPRFHGIRTGIQEVAIDSADILRCVSASMPCFAKAGCNATCIGVQGSKEMGRRRLDLILKLFADALQNRSLTLKVHCIVVTGYGKSRHSWRSSDVQQAALEVLKNLELEAQVLPQNKGRIGVVLLKRDMLKLRSAGEMFGFV